MCTSTDICTNGGRVSSRNRSRLLPGCGLVHGIASFMVLFYTADAVNAVTLPFAGRSWTVKESLTPVGPGPNIFSSNPNDVWSDAAGLHLTVQQTGPTWFSTEVILDQNLGYGTYMFQTDSRNDILDANVVFGAFTWDPNGTSPIPGDPNREIDFEDSRWSDPSAVFNSSATVQPFSVPGNVQQFTLPDLSADSKLTRFFTWSPGKVEFTTLRGHHSPLSFSPADVIHQSTYLDDGVTHFVPVPDREAFRFNLWLTASSAPLGGQTVEVLINDFQHIPLPPVDDTLLYDFETGSQGWFSFGTVGIANGLLPTGGSSGQGRFHSGDFSLPEVAPNFGIGEISPLGLDLSTFVGLSVDALFKDVAGQPPFVGTKELEIIVENSSGEEFMIPVTMTDTYQTFIVAFDDFQSVIDSLAPSITDLSDAAIKLVVRNTSGSGTAELNYDQIIGLGSINNADFDADLVVDGNDFLAWQRGFGNGSLHSEGDANSSQTVDGADLALFQSQFGEITGALPAVSAGAATVPEPSSALLSLVAILGWTSLRRRAS